MPTPVEIGVPPMPPLPVYGLLVDEAWCLHFVMGAWRTKLEFLEIRALNLSTYVTSGLKTITEPWHGGRLACR